MKDQMKDPGNEVEYGNEVEHGSGLLLYPTRHCELLYFSSIRVLLLAINIRWISAALFSPGLFPIPPRLLLVDTKERLPVKLLHFSKIVFVDYRNVLLSVVILSLLFASLFTAVFNVKV